MNIQISSQIAEIDHISKVWGIKATDTNYKSRKYMIYIKFKVQSEKRINNDSNEIPSC